MQKNLTNGDVPIGFGMALAQNLESMKYFSGLSEDMQKNIINKTKGIKSREEMQSFVDSIRSMEL